jgi:hypothetical protein
MVDEQTFNSVMQMRSQGLTDNIIMAELGKQGIDAGTVEAALAKADMAPGGMAPGSMPPMPGGNGMPAPPGMAPVEMAPPNHEQSSLMHSSSASSEEGNIYERIEEITEGMIDEKWDELIAEVKKIISWKEQVEEKQNSLLSDITKLKDDFKLLHGGVLGKLEDYDNRMRDVGSELKAVGKVFKDVIPEFVENVKELKSVKDELKGR